MIKNEPVAKRPVGRPRNSSVAAVFARPTQAAVVPSAPLNQIPAQMESVENTVFRIESAVDNLAKILESVLSENGTGVTGVNPSGDLVPHAHRLFALNARLECIEQSINDLSVRCAL